MIVITFIVLIIYLILFLLTRKEEVVGTQSIIEKPFGKLAVWLYQKAPFECLKSVRVKENLNILYPAKKMSELQRDYYVEKIKLTLIIFFAGNVLVFFLSIQILSEGELVDGNRIYRNKGGEGQKTVEATAYITTEEETTRTPLQITVNEVKYESQAVEEMFQEISGELGMAILGQNDSPDKVTEPLNLLTSYKEYPITISWTSSDYNLIDEEGNVNNKELPNPAAVILTAILKYEDKKEEVEIPVILYEKDYLPEEKLQRNLVKSIEEADSGSRLEESVSLPEQIEGYSVRYVEKPDSSPSLLWIMLVICGVLVYFSKDSKLQSQIDKRNQMLLYEYSEFVSKLTLLVGAGMNVKGAIMRIVALYEEKKTGHFEKNYCYEELKIAIYEIENGVYEEKAYENFGKRCKIPIYIKLSGLLAQNVKKGTKDLLHLLQKEAEEAFEDRKSAARTLGEEAGTKLLLPMVMMLAVVMVLIIVPAFLSYQM